MMPMAIGTANRSRVILLLVGTCGAVMAATLALWAYFGTTVFFEVVRAGWAACF